MTDRRNYVLKTTINLIHSSKVIKIKRHSLELPTRTLVNWLSLKRREANSPSILLSEQQRISLQAAVRCLVSNKIKGERTQCHWLFPEGFASHTPPLTEHVTSINTMLYCLHCCYGHRILLVAQRLRKISETGLDSWVSALGPGEHFCEHGNVTYGSGSVVGIATAYELHGSRIESWWGRDFLHLSRSAQRLTQPPVQWVPGISRG